MESSFKKEGVSVKVDSGSSAIGKRYARTDELGIPFAITVDYQTSEDNTVTLRDLVSTKQVRIAIKDLFDVIKSTIAGKMTFAEISTKYPEVESSKE